jgi:hypothetical protein
LDLWLKSYEVFKISVQVGACCQPLSMQQNLPKTAQNCPKLPQFAKICPKMKLWNSTKNRDFSIFLNKKFVRVEEALEHVFTIWIFNPRIFHMLFLLSKNGLCVWISAYPLGENDFFLNVPHLLWIWDFEDMDLTHLETRIWRGTFHIYFLKWLFWPSKLCCPLRVCLGKKLFCQLWMLWSCKWWGMSE